MKAKIQAHGVHAHEHEESKRKKLKRDAADPFAAALDQHLAQHAQVQHVAPHSAVTPAAAKPKHASAHEPAHASAEPANREAIERELKSKPALAEPTAAPPTQPKAPVFTPQAAKNVQAVDPLRAPEPVAAPKLPDEPSLQGAVLLRAAHLKVESSGESVELHLRVHGGVTDLRIATTGHENFLARTQELQTALAQEGLLLGGFETSQREQRDPQRQADDAEVPLRPGTRRALSSVSVTPPSVARSDAAVTVKA